MIQPIRASNINLDGASILDDAQSKKKRATGAHVKINEAAINDIEPVFSEREIAALFQAKCHDLNIKMYPQQFLRFRDNINNICYNRKCNL